MAPFDTKAASLQALVENEGYGLELIERVKEMTRGELVLMQGGSIRRFESTMVSSNPPWEGADEAVP